MLPARSHLSVASLGMRQPRMPQVLTLSFSDGFPHEDSLVLEQIYAIAVASVG